MCISNVKCISIFCLTVLVCTIVLFVESLAHLANICGVAFHIMHGLNSRIFFKIKLF